MAETLSDYQKDILIRTALGEARGEGVEGMADVIQTIFNRANDPRFPSDPAAAALENKQYSTWNTGAGGNNPQQFSKDSDIYKRAERALELVTSGTRPDYTGGAVFYKTPSVNSPFHDSQNKYGTIERNGHLYYPTRPVPPGEIPNQVASLTDTVGPRVPPNPVAMTPDLAQMRNPQMSTSARNAQVTPSANTPLPRPRPTAPDIVTPTMASLARPTGNVNATRGVDMLASTANPVTPRLTPAGDNIYSYHIPDMTPTAIAGGMGSLTPQPQRQSLPAIPRTVPGQSQIERTMPSAREIATAPGTTIATYPTSGIGQPPITRSVPSIPMNMAPTQAEIDRAPGQVIGTYPTRPMGSAPNNIIDQRAEQLGLRPAASARLMPGVAAQNYDVALNGPVGLTRQQFGALPSPGIPPVAMATPGFGRIQVVPPVASVPRRTAPVPMAASMRPMMPMQQAQRPMVQQQRAPLRAIVQGGTYNRQVPVPMPSTMHPQQLTSAQNYDRLVALSRGNPGLDQRVSERYNSGAQSLSS